MILLSNHSAVYQPRPSFLYHASPLPIKHTAVKGLRRHGGRAQIRKTSSPPGISPPFGNAAEHSRPLARFGETPMVGKLAPLPLRLMLCTSQPTRFESACFYIWGSTPDPNLPLFTTGSGGCAPSCQTCHNRHLNSGWIARSPSRSVSEGPLPTIGVKETAISLPGSANHENQPVFSRAWLDRTSEK